MLFAIGESLAFVVPLAEEWFFAAGANKVVNVEVFAKRRDHSLLDRPSARAAYGYAHLVVAFETVEVFVHLARIWPEL